MGYKSPKSNFKGTHTPDILNRILKCTRTEICRPRQKILPDGNSVVFTAMK
jgi:hypothetical protein